MNEGDQKKVKQYIAAYNLIEHHSQPGNLIADIYTGPDIAVNATIFEGGKRPITNAIYYLVVGTVLDVSEAINTFPSLSENIKMFFNG